MLRCKDAYLGSIIWRRSLTACWNRATPAPPLPMFPGQRCVATATAMPKGIMYPMPDNLPDGCVLHYQHRGRAFAYNPETSTPEHRGVAVAVLGASGQMGRQIVMSLASHRRDFMGCGPMTLQLVGRRGSESASLNVLSALCTELRDAFDDVCPHLEVVCDVAAVRADIIVMAAGATLSRRHLTHTELARANADIFDDMATKLITHNSRALILVVSNPVSFGVDTFVEAGFNAQSVFGTGAHLDSLRFRREIASELGVARQHVTGLVLGMHGLSCVPCWSTVHLSTIAASAEMVEKLEKMKEEGISRMPKDIETFSALAYHVRDLAFKQDSLAAIALVSRQPADVRAALKRYISFFVGPACPRVGVGEKVGRVVSYLLSGRTLASAAQLHLGGGYEGIVGTDTTAFGAPALISNRGAHIDKSVKLLDVEKEALRISQRDSANFHTAVKAIKSLRMASRNRNK